MYCAWAGPIFFSTSKFEDYMSQYNKGCITNSNIIDNSDGLTSGTVGLTDNK